MLRREMPMCFHVGFQFLAECDKMLIVNLSHDL